MKTMQELRTLLTSIDHKSYPAYKALQGAYRYSDFVLSIDHVQGDPFAAPSCVSVLVPMKAAGFPADFLSPSYKRIALQDHLLRLFSKKLDSYAFRAKGSGKSGLLSCSRCGQQILERTSCTITGEGVQLRFEIGFPANGRTINAAELAKILFDFLPVCVHTTLLYGQLDAKAVADVLSLAEDQAYIRHELNRQGLVAFVGNGSILPRESGVSQKPLPGAIPFTSPSSMEISLSLPSGKTIQGMGIPRGITLIVGGGYHGKSTLLKALETGVYNHIRGDGREYVITVSDAMKIRAEDGRSISQMDISLFINHLPGGSDTTAFSTPDASGSTSQAANVMESLESGASVLLLDEDTSATNFMIRDEQMQQVIHRDQEPITHFLERARLLYERFGVSIVLVAGSCGAFFHIADTILQLDSYQTYEITQKAKEISAHYPWTPSAPPYTNPCPPRIPCRSPKIAQEDRLKLRIQGTDGIVLGHEAVDLRCVEQLLDAEQTAALGYLFLYACRHLFDGQTPLPSIVRMLYAEIQDRGMAFLVESKWIPNPMALPRPQEFFAFVNRYRGRLFR